MCQFLLEFGFCMSLIETHTKELFSEGKKEENLHFFLYNKDINSTQCVLAIVKRKGKSKSSHLKHLQLPSFFCVLLHKDYIRKKAKVKSSL